MPSIPDFTEAAWQAGRSDGDLSHSIRHGKGKLMPAMGAKLGTAGVGRLVALVRAFRDGERFVPEEETPSPSAPRGPATVATSAAAPWPDTARPPSRATERVRAGGLLYRRLCSVCHGTDGRGDGVPVAMHQIPDFTGRAWQERRGDAQLMISILEGRGSGMPAFRGKIGEEQARSLVAFIRAFGPRRGRTAGTDPDDFEARFRQLQEGLEGMKRQFRELESAADRAEARRSTRPTPR